MQEAASMAASAGVPVWFEPVSVPKAARAAGSLHLLEYISPNAAELVSISEALAAGKSSLPQHGSEQPSAGQNSETAGRKRVMELWHHIKRVLSAGPRNIVLTLGADGAALCTLGYVLPSALQACFNLCKEKSLLGRTKRALMWSFTFIMTMQCTWEQRQGSVYTCGPSSAGEYERGRRLPGCRLLLGPAEGAGCPSQLSLMAW